MKSPSRKSPFLTTWSPVLVVAALFLLAAQAATPSARFGVVDLNAVFEGYKKKDTLEQELAAAKKTVEAKIEKITAQIQEQRSELELLEKGTSRFEDVEDKIAALLQKRNREQVRARDDFQRRKAEFHEQILGELQEGIERYARENGYAAIFQREFSMPTESLSWRTVLYHDEHVDLTDEILAAVNQ